MSARLRCRAPISSMIEVPRRRAAIAEEHLILMRPHHYPKLITIYNKLSSQRSAKRILNFTRFIEEN